MIKGRLLQLQGIESTEIAYNPAVIVQKNTDQIVGGSKIIAVRVESLDSHWLNPKLYDPRVRFFYEQDDNILEPIPDTPVFYQAEDPWATWFKDKQGNPQLLFGVVVVDYSGSEPVITTRLHLAPSVQALVVDKPLIEIRGMKDVRVVQLPNGQIAVFSRPTTGVAFPGRIGFTIVENLLDINQALATAPLLKFELDKKTKIGANEAYLVNDRIHVFGHMATIDARGLHYAAYEFSLDPKHPCDEVIALNKVADRADFPANTQASKGHQFDDVVFPGGTGGPEYTELYVGVEDARIGKIELGEE